MYVILPLTFALLVTVAVSIVYAVAHAASLVSFQLPF